ncbi:unnamed protein product [Rotaria magnacalcarata]|uniref:Uncharacterized protein n=2 Tax=Rotaria magnacalcarata TaxID=392030 RepID=A0A815K0I5_9BILA|nr:unnamed protein product [Rotaria magnacalcarata]CAF1465881.1 unnamed protein product [Rotaria magnacalcarata]CAF2102083.1 unnamed protein product [Rotaria magnacalcarata]CAF2144837.1 unnamed protein product [Rotaria magnacalcarata]CAF2209526.1 unnamed protein product [Rotaria magnacalcarata]
MSSDPTIEDILQQVVTNQDESAEEGTSTTNRYASYGTIRATSSFINNAPIRTNGVEETNRYLRRSVHDVYWDPNPQVIHKETTGLPVTVEQRVILRCLQPPPLPPPEPLIIIEKRPDQPPPPSPLVIHEHQPAVSTPPPLIIRERPPVPPLRVPSETITRWLPPVQLPPRSLVIERFPASETPQDIIIERWLPYGPAPERRTIVKPAPPAMKYPLPTHTIIIHDKAPARIVRKIEKSGATREDPEDYMRRYGSSLLDSARVLERARQAGVIEDITCTCPQASSLIIVDNRSSCETNENNRVKIINECGCSCGGRCRCAYRETCSTGMQGYSVAEASTSAHRYYSSSESRRIDCNTSCNCIAIQNSDFAAN